MQIWTIIETIANIAEIVTLLHARNSTMFVSVGLFTIVMGLLTWLPQSQQVQRGVALLFTGIL